MAAFLAAVAIFAGHPVPVSCVQPAEIHWNLGWYDGEHDRIALPRSVCRQLEQPTAFALMVGLHEAAHAAGVTDERRADCRAASWFRYAARRFYRLSSAAAATLYRTIPASVAAHDCHAPA